MPGTFGQVPAALQKLLKGKLQENDPSSVLTKQISILLLYKCSATQRDDARSSSAIQNGAQGFALNRTESAFAFQREDFTNAVSSAALNFAVKIKKAPLQQPGQRASRGALTRGHKAGKRDELQIAGWA